MSANTYSAPDGSPLLRRVRRETGRFTGIALPRRGRIRAVLILAGIALCWLALRGRGSATTGVPARVERAPEVRAVKPQPAPEPQVPPRPAAPRPPRDDLSFEEVAVLLRRHASQLSLSGDTLHTGRKHFIVHYSVDTALQRYGATLLRRYHPKYGAIAVMESATGRVLALVSYTHEGEPYLGRDLYARSLFPAASVFKIVSAAGAMEKGRLTPDSELRYSGRNYTLYNSQLAGTLRDYRTVTLQHAFAHSINPVFGRIGINVLGRDGLLEYAARFGFGLETPFELAVDTALLGPCDSAYAQAEVACGFNQQTRMSPLFGALLACAVSENGTMPAPHVVDSIIDMREWRRVYRAESQAWRAAVRPVTAANLARMMQEVVRAGTARESFGIVKNTRAFDGFRCGGKTGSVDRDGVGRVDWFVGFAAHPSDPERRLAAGIVTVHGAQWTVHSSYLAAEMFRLRIRALARHEAVVDARGQGDGDG